MREALHNAHDDGDDECETGSVKNWFTIHARSEHWSVRVSSFPTKQRAEKHLTKGTLPRKVAIALDRKSFSSYMIKRILRVVVSVVV